ncbi:pyridoxal-dependent decarboxylase [bacterium]|nr:pyridoxal-dependent decarboxylase [bacterium]
MKIPDSIQSAYDPETFRDQAHQLVDFLADQLADSIADRSDQKTIKYSVPDQAIASAESLPGGNRFFEQVWQDCIRLHNPKFMGHQIMPPLPISAMAGFFSDMLNNGMGVYEMGIAGTAIERTVIKQICQRLGFDPAADGILTCGGSLANLTAMLAARSHCSKDNDWNQGTKKQLALMVSEQSHYCVDRAARIMGWGESGVIKIPSDDQYRMRTELLEPALEKAKSHGITPIAVVGSACSTSTGSFDDLEAIGEFCQNQKLWFHVDGAHGAANAFSAKYKHLVKGIALADSVTLDFHKMLMTPAITSALLFRDGNQSYGSFSQNAEYLWGESDSAEWFNLAKRTFECTKTMLSLKVFSIIATHGWEIFDANVSRLNDLAKTFANKLTHSSDFDVAISPQTNIVCYRYSGGSPECSNQLNSQIRQRLLEQGDFYIVQTVLDETVWLRSAISNPLTEEKHFDQLLDQIRRLAKELQ